MYLFVPGPELLYNYKVGKILVYAEQDLCIFASFTFHSELAWPFCAHYSSILHHMSGCQNPAAANHGSAAKPVFGAVIAGDVDPNQPWLLHLASSRFTVPHQIEKLRIALNPK